MSHALFKLVNYGWKSTVEADFTLCWFSYYSIDNGASVSGFSSYFTQGYSQDFRNT